MLHRQKFSDVMNGQDDVTSVVICRMRDVSWVSSVQSESPGHLILLVICAVHTLV